MKNERFCDLFETMTQGVVYHDARGRIVAANPAALEVLGLSLNELIGRTSMDSRAQVIREDGSELPAFEQPAQMAPVERRPIRNVVMGVFHPREKRYRWLLVNAVPQFRPGHGDPYQVYAMFDDITGLKEIQDALSAGQWRKDVLGKDYFEMFLPSEARPAVAADMDKVMAGGQTKGFENMVKAIDGRERTLVLSVNRLVDDGETTGVVAVGQDISARKESGRRTGNEPEDPKRSKRHPEAFVGGPPS